MYHPLPEDHGIPEDLLRTPLMHFDANGNIRLTQAQLSGINAKAALGKSLLLVAPTSSGKTTVGLLAASTWLRGGDGLSRQVVYLVTHRALARQKFNELRCDDFLEIFEIGAEELVLATGDQVIDARDTPVEAPLSGRLIIATYEKYLAVLAGSGHRSNMKNVCVVADEIQILGDARRGRAVEVLLTIIRNAHYGQFIGLSAVLCERDRVAIANWMGIELVVENLREVPLAFELRTETTTYEWSTDGSAEVIDTSVRRPQHVIGILKELAVDPAANFPVAVFCMTKRRIKDLMRAWEQQCPSAGPDLLDLGLEEETASSVVLESCLPKGFGIHTADLIDLERAVVEKRLYRGDLPVVFATTTLAQGLNYSFKTVIFDHWARYVFEQRTEEPISHSEFHNISGRSGRLELQDRGRVIFSAKGKAHLRAAKQYLSSELPEMKLGHVEVADFEAISLQLVSAELATSRDDLFSFLAESLTGYLARDRTMHAEEEWVRKLDHTIDRLRGSGFLS